MGNQNSGAKNALAETFKRHPADVGSSGVQVAQLTFRINSLAEHFKKNPKDNHSRRGLLKMVSQRRSLLDYIKGRDEQLYRKLLEDLGIRR